MLIPVVLSFCTTSTTHTHKYKVKRQQIAWNRTKPSIKLRALFLSLLCVSFLSLAIAWCMFLLFLFFLCMRFFSLYFSYFEFNICFLFEHNLKKWHNYVIITHHTHTRPMWAFSMKDTLVRVLSLSLLLSCVVRLMRINKDGYIMRLYAVSLWVVDKLFRIKNATNNNSRCACVTSFWLIINYCQKIKVKNEFIE